MFIMAYNIYKVVKSVTTLRPNLGFFPRTPAPPCLKISLICLSYSLLLVTVMLMDSWAWVGPDSGGAAGLSHPWHPLLIHHQQGV